MKVGHCKLQAFGVTTFVLQFVLPLIICIAAYGRILQVLRRQAKVMPGQPRTITVASKDTAAGPSKVTAASEVTDSGLTVAERENATSEAKATVSRNKAGRGFSTGLSKAKVNVIRTMILILVCFAICLFPHDFYSVYKTFKVFTKSLTHSLLL